MTSTLDVRLFQLRQAAISTFGNELVAIARTDAFLRQPDYSSRSFDQVYLILKHASLPSCIDSARYLQGDFPEISFNYLLGDELARFPRHGIWQFLHAQWIHGAEAAHELLGGAQFNTPEALRQAVFSVSHLSRLYYFREPTPKFHLWGVRQFGWATRYIERGLLPLWQKHASGQAPCIRGPSAEDLDWVRSCNANWPEAERRMLQSVPVFQSAALRLSRIAEEYCGRLDTLSDPNQDQAPDAHALIATPPEWNALASPMALALGGKLVAIHLHGSAARGEQHERSDIDVLAVVTDADDRVLQGARKVAADHPRVSLGLLSLAGLRQYPRFRRYTLAPGLTRCIFGAATALPDPSTRGDDVAAVDNNLHTIRQVARAYLASGAYGSRAHAAAVLMVKLADHGCLRLLQKLATGVYPSTRAASRDFHEASSEFAELLIDIDQVSQIDARLRDTLLAGNRDTIESQFIRLLRFADACSQHVHELNASASMAHDS